MNYELIIKDNIIDFMKIYVFGNCDDEKDKIAFEVANSLKKTNKEIEFKEIKPNEDLPFENEEEVVLMDAVWGINKVTVIEDINKLVLSPRNSVHDFDLSFQLKYLRKLGKIGKVKIIGLPMEKKVDIEEIRKIIEKI